MSIMRPHDRFSRHRPPWWPPDETWPPAPDARAHVWRRMRGRFFWRVGFFLFLFFLFSTTGGLAIVWLILHWLGLFPLPGPVAFPLQFIGALLLVFIGMGIVFRGFRRATAPIADVMEAADRVAAGDYSTRVAEHGPREVRETAHAFNEMTARLQRNDEQRRNLLADVTHELRTPLTVIQGNLEGLLDGVYPRDDGHLTMILEETRLMSRLIEDLRTLALAEAGMLRLEKEPTDLASLVDETLASFKPQADEAGVALTAGTEPNLPRIEIDATRIRQVLENLIANALRYTPRGGEIHLSTQSQGQRVVCAISDTGAGIPTEELSSIFDRFYKGSDSRGSGLGLAIAKNLVVAHGGEISADSLPGKGTTIRFTLPLV